MVLNRKVITEDGFEIEFDTYIDEVLLVVSLMKEYENVSASTITTSLLHYLIDENPNCSIEKLFYIEKYPSHIYLVTFAVIGYKAIIKERFDLSLEAIQTLIPSI